MSAFSGGDGDKGAGEEQSLYDRFKKLTGRAPVVLEATAPPKSDDELKKDEEDLAKQFQSIFGTKPFAYHDSRDLTNSDVHVTEAFESDNVKQKDEELARRFESIFGERPVAYGERGTCGGEASAKETAIGNVSDNWISETVNKLPYDGNDDEIDLLFAETEDANKGDLADSTASFLGEVRLKTGNNTYGEDGVVVTSIISDEAEKLIKQTKQNVVLERSMGNTNVDGSRPALFGSSFGISDNDTLDDEVLEVIRKAKEEATLDNKFGFFAKDDEGDRSDENSRTKSGESTKSDSSYASSSDDNDY